MIQPYKAPFGVSILFWKKQYGTLGICVNYRALNKYNVKNKYSVLLIQDFLDRLCKASFLSKLDLRSGYWKVHIAVGEAPKTSFVTRYGSYKFLVMSFGLTNDPTTFYNLMKNILYEYIDEFLVIYLDDIHI